MKAPPRQDDTPPTPSGICYLVPDASRYEHPLEIDNPALSEKSLEAWIAFIQALYQEPEE